jgi:hypothetical protein
MSDKHPEQPFTMSAPEDTSAPELRHTLAYLQLEGICTAMAAGCLSSSAREGLIGELENYLSREYSRFQSFDVESRAVPGLRMILGGLAHLRDACQALRNAAQRLDINVAEPLSMGLIADCEIAFGRRLLQESAAQG